MRVRLSSALSLCLLVVCSVYGLAETVQQSSGSSTSCVQTSAPQESSNANIVAVQRSLSDLKADVSALKNDPSKYWLLLVGGIVGVVSSLLTALVNGIIANRNKKLELDALSTSKTKELLVTQIIGFRGKTQPRASILAGVKGLIGIYPDLTPLFREFLVSQMEYLITYGVSAPLEQRNALTIAQAGNSIFTHEEWTRIDEARLAHPNGSVRGLKLSSETGRIIDNNLG